MPPVSGISPAARSSINHCICAADSEYVFSSLTRKLLPCHPFFVRLESGNAGSWYWQVMNITKAAQAGSATLARWHALLATWLGELFDGMDASIFVLVLFPALSELTGTTDHSAVGLVGSVVLALFMIGWAAGAIVFGILADSIGRARTLVITILLYAICTGLCAIASSWWELAFYRFLVGCGIGGEISIGAVILAEYWRGRGRIHAVAVMSTSFGFGYLAAALLNLALGHLGWRWLFVAGILPALLTVYIRARLKEPEQFEAVKARRKALRLKPKAGLTSEEAKLLRFPLPELFAGENRIKTFSVMALASSAIIGYWAVLSWIPAWINQLTGTLAVDERSAAAIALNLGAILSAAVTGLIVDRIGRAGAFRLSFAGALASTTCMFLTVKAFGTALLAFVFAAGFFGVMPFVVLFIYVPELFEARIRGTAFGFSVQIGRIFAACAAIAGGHLIGMFGGSYALAGAAVALFYAVGILASLVMPETAGKTAEEVEEDGWVSIRQAGREPQVAAVMERAAR